MRHVRLLSSFFDNIIPASWHLTLARAFLSFKGPLYKGQRVGSEAIARKLRKHVLLLDHISSILKTKNPLTRMYHNREFCFTVLNRGIYNLPDQSNPERLLQHDLPSPQRSHRPHPRRNYPLPTGSTLFRAATTPTPSLTHNNRPSSSSPSFALSHSILSSRGRNGKIYSPARLRKERRRLALQSFCWGAMFRKHILQSR